MDTRATLDPPQPAPLDSIPELAGLAEAAPRLTADGPVARRAAVSLIVPTFFNGKLKGGVLEELLGGLEASAAVDEVVIVAADRDPRERAALEKLSLALPWRVIDAPANNRAQSRNLGARAANGELLLFLDDDMVLRNWRLVDVLVSKLLVGSFDCALFPRRLYARFPLLYDRSELGRAIALWKQGREPPAIVDLARQTAADLPLLFCFPGCFMLVRQSAFKKLGGFDERFVGWGFEDTDFAIRAIQTLRVLNLFRAGEPLLHVDHPVSPYKSEEHQSNCGTFFSRPDAVEVDRLCRTIFPGRDFIPVEARMPSAAIHLGPFAALKKQDVPPGLDEGRLFH